MTPFGRRTFREWVSKPLARISAIEDRLNAVEDLMMHSDLSSSVRALLKKLPDLERLLARIHSFAIARDKKAIMYENVDKKKLNVFLTVLDGYEKSLDIVKAFETVKDSFKSKKLRRLVNLSSEGGDFPDLRSDLQIFNDAFDRQDALARGFILPRSGFDSEYDSINQRLSEVEMNLNSILKGVQKQFKDSSIKYVHKNKEVYQLEISENTLNRAGQLPEEFEHLSRRKGFQRFWTPEIKDLISEQEKLSNEKESLQNDLSRKFFSRFCEKFRLWRKGTFKP